MIETSDYADFLETRADEDYMEGVVEQIRGYSEGWAAAVDRLFEDGEWVEAAALVLGTEEEYGELDLDPYSEEV